MPTLTDEIKAITTAAHKDKLMAVAHHEYSMAALKQIHEAGVPVLAGTDIGYPYAPLLHAEIEIMVKDGGFTRAEALATVTLNPAKIYPMLADRGRIAPGLRGGGAWCSLRRCCFAVERRNHEDAQRLLRSG